MGRRFYHCFECLWCNGLSSSVTIPKESSERNWQKKNVFHWSCSVSYTGDYCLIWTFVFQKWGKVPCSLFSCSSVAAGWINQPASCDALRPARQRVWSTSDIWWGGTYSRSSGNREFSIQVHVLRILLVVVVYNSRNTEFYSNCFFSPDVEYCRYLLSWNLAKFLLIFDEKVIWRETFLLL